MGGTTARGGRRYLLLLPLVVAGNVAAQARQAARFETIFDAGFTVNATVGFSEDQIRFAPPGRPGRSGRRASTIVLRAGLIIPLGRASD